MNFTSQSSESYISQSASNEEVDVLSITTDFKALSLVGEGAEGKVFKVDSPRKLRKTTESDQVALKVHLVGK
jgi:hypothetical protein